MKVAVVFLAALLVLPTFTLAQDDDEKELGWKFEGELTGLWNSGNSESNTFGAMGKLEYYWPTSRFMLLAGGTRTESSIITRTAAGTESDYQLVEDRVSDVTAELYFGRVRFDHDLTPKFYTFGLVDWIRNRFAGVESRYLLAIGAGNHWIDNETTSFKTDYAVTYTFQDEIVENPVTGTKFPGLRVAYDLTHQLTTSTEFLSYANFDMNLDSTDDMRVAWYNGLSISISEKLFFKPGYTVLWRNEPAYSNVDLVDGAGMPTGTMVPVQFDKWDTILSISLLAKF